MLTLAVLLRDFEVEAVDGRVALGQGITLQVTSPMRLRVRPRGAVGQGPGAGPGTGPAHSNTPKPTSG